MSRITIIGDKEVTNPVAKAAISIAVVPLTLMFVAAVLIGTFLLWAQCSLSRSAS